VFTRSCRTAPIVLIGHSMGGMTIMALAEQDPELFADRVCGVMLIATLGRRGRQARVCPAAAVPVQPGHPRRRPCWPAGDPAWSSSSARPAAASPGAPCGRSRSAHRDVSPSLVDFMVEMLNVTPVRVLTDSSTPSARNNRYAALAGLKHAHVVVLSGDQDLDHALPARRADGRRAARR